MSKVYQIHTVQKMPVSLEQAWDFFSSPANLQVITPAYLQFKILSDVSGEKIFPGQIIEYRVKPLLGLNLYWMTEITQVKEKDYFIDEQRYGPYSLWHHQHHFKEIKGGVEMRDKVHYKLPLWILGDLGHALFIKKQLKKIFAYRYRKVEELFGTMP